MKELPLFDESVPITCTIESSDRSGRRELLEKMRSVTLSTERTDSGILLTFLRDETPLFEEFASLEKECCAFFGFAVDSGVLRWEAPTDAAQIMDSLVRFFSDPTYPAERILNS